MNYERAIGYEQGMQQGMEILVESHIKLGIAEISIVEILQEKYNLDKEEALELIASVKEKM